MATNPDNAGGLPALPEPVRMGLNDVIPFSGYYTADQMRAYGELCRAASVASDDAVGVLEMILDGRISGRISEWPQIKPAISEVLRALSRGVPEGE